MKSERLLSLDILRGITIVGMILVNNPGTWESIYAPLRHAEWNGLTPTDLVFPFFMFIMGVSMSFALSRFDHHFSRGFIIKLVRRTVILFLLGLFLSWFSLHRSRTTFLAHTYSGSVAAVGIGLFLWFLADCGCPASGKSGMDLRDHSGRLFHLAGFGTRI